MGKQKYTIDDYEKDAIRYYNSANTSGKGYAESVQNAGIAIERLCKATYYRFYKKAPVNTIDFVEYLNLLESKKVIPKLITIKFHSLRRISNLAKHTPVRFGKMYIDSCRYDMTLIFNWYEKRFKIKLLGLKESIAQIEKRKDSKLSIDKRPNITDGLERPPIINSTDNEFITDLYDLGIIGTVNKLSESQLKPPESMKTSNRHLFFMGILGSKWVKNEKLFRDFLVKIQSFHGQVKFLMINPKSDGFKLLKTMRGEYLKDNSSVVFKKFVDEFPCLEARYYDFLPSFRLIFMDNKILAVSRYKLDKDNYIKGNKGWEAPHLIIEPNNKTWSLFNPFMSYFETTWKRAIPINELF